MLNKRDLLCPDAFAVAVTKVDKQFKRQTVVWPKSTDGRWSSTVAVREREWKSDGEGAGEKVSG